MLSPVDIDTLVNTIHAQYASCNVVPSNDYQYTVLAAFVLVGNDNQGDKLLDFDSCQRPSSSLSVTTSSPKSKVATSRKEFKVISLATGAKCLPTSRFPLRGDALHDSHAEVLARRGVVRWLLEEACRAAHSSHGSLWLTCNPHERGTWMLRAQTTLVMYVSTVPCGDASIRLLASQQDPVMTALKDSSCFRGPLASPVAPPPLPTVGTARGRDGYAYHGILRTKPGRADSPPTLCLSCSDKIAAWTVLGVQGALTARVFAQSPVYVRGIILGDVPAALREDVLEDCERAFFRRVECIQNLPTGYRVTRPFIYFTDLAFLHSRTSLQACRPAEPPPASYNESLCWYADSFQGQEVIINGTRRGVGAKQRGFEKFRPRLCKLQLFRLYAESLKALNLDIPCDISTSTYFRAKQASSPAYQHARAALKGGHMHSRLPCPIPTSATTSATNPSASSAASALSPSESKSETSGDCAAYPLGGISAASAVVVVPPFGGWLVSGEQWESFDIEGNLLS